MIPSPRLITRMLMPGLVLAAFVLTGCATSRGNARMVKTLAPFTTDGCSLFPDGTFTHKDLWLSCCIDHDRAYWQGGTEEERMRADQELKDCIIAKTGDVALAQMVHDAVRFGGAPYFPTWYRWGYGWNFRRPYGPLTASELRQVDSRWREFQLMAQ